MDFNNKKGNEFIEGALVLPLIILIILSLIMVTVHFYRAGENQFLSHGKALRDMKNHSEIYSRIKFSSSKSSRIDGAIKYIIKSENKGYCTELNELKAIRIGILANETFEE